MVGRDAKVGVVAAQIVDRSVGHNEEMENGLDGNEGISDGNMDGVIGLFLETFSACTALV